MDHLYDEDEWYPFEMGLSDFETSTAPDCLSLAIIEELETLDARQTLSFSRSTVRVQVEREDIVELIAQVAVDSVPLKLPSVVVFAEREDEHLVASECGDDNIKFTNQPALALVSSLYCRRIFGMKVSIPDSFLSQRVGNYTEKWAMMPRDRMDLVTKLLVKGSDRTTPLIDLPALRAGLPTADQSREISSSILGKAQLYYRCLSYSRNSVEEPLCWKASIFQDVALSVMTKGRVFPYLPQVLGGLGKPFPMNSKENIVRAARAYKRGKYERLIYTIISHSKELVDPSSGVYSPDPLIERVKQLFAGYDPQHSYFRKNVPLTKGLVPPHALQYLVGEFSTSAASNAALRRLRTSGMIVAERDIIMANEVEEHVYNMLSSEPDIFKELKTSTYNSFRSEVVRGRSFLNLFNEVVEVHVFSYGLNDEEKSFGVWMDLDNTFRVSNFMFGERFFLRDALDNVFFRGPSKVSFPLILPDGRRFAGRMGQKVALEDPPPDELLKDYEDLVAWAIDPGDRLPPRSLLEDDEIILEEVRTAVLREKNPFFVAIIVTEDSALCSKINEVTEAVVIMLPTSILFHAMKGVMPIFRGKNRRESVGLLVQQFSQKVPASIALNVFDTGDVWVDTGSWSAVSERESTFPYVQPTVVRDNTRMYFEYRGTQSSLDRLIRAIEGWPMKSHTFDRGHLLDMHGKEGNPQVGPDREWKTPSLKGGLFHSFVRGLTGKAKSVSRSSRRAFLKSRDLERPEPERPTEEQMRNLFFGDEEDV